MHRDAVRVPPAGGSLDTGEFRIGAALERVLRMPAVADKSFLVTIGDRTVGGLVARDQMAGPWQVPVADCAVTLSDFLGCTGEAMAMGEPGADRVARPARRRADGGGGGAHEHRRGRRGEHRSGGPVGELDGCLRGAG